MGLNHKWRLDALSYWVRRSGPVVFREQHGPGETLVYDAELALLAIGFGKLGTVFGWAEFVASNLHLRRCSARFGAQLTPALVQAAEPESQAVVWGLRALLNIPLVAEGRRRQATAVEG